MRITWAVSWAVLGGRLIHHNLSFLCNLVLLGMPIHVQYNNYRDQLEILFSLVLVVHHMGLHQTPIYHTLLDFQCTIMIPCLYLWIQQYNYSTNNDLLWSVMWFTFYTQFKLLLCLMIFVPWIQNIVKLYEVWQLWRVDSKYSLPLQNWN